MLSFFLHSYKVTGHGKGIYIYDKLVFFVQDIVAKLFSPKILFFFMALIICYNVGQIRFSCIDYVKSLSDSRTLRFIFVENKA